MLPLLSDYKKIKCSDFNIKQWEIYTEAVEDIQKQTYTMKVINLIVFRHFNKLSSLLF